MEERPPLIGLRVVGVERAEIEDDAQLLGECGLVLLLLLLFCRPWCPPPLLVAGEGSCDGAEEEEEDSNGCCCCCCRSLRAARASILPWRPGSGAEAALLPPTPPLSSRS